MIVKSRKNELNILLIADDAVLAGVVSDEMQKSGIDGEIMRLPPGGQAISCVRRTGTYQRTSSPDLVLFDYSRADEYTTDVLRKIAFDDDKTQIPVVLLISPETQRQLDDGEVDGGKAVMFSPTEFRSFIGKLRIDNRVRFIKALRTLYEYGPILVRAPRRILQRHKALEPVMALSA